MNLAAASLGFRFYNYVYLCSGARAWDCDLPFEIIGVYDPILSSSTGKNGGIVAMVMLAMTVMMAM